MNYALFLEFIMRTNAFVQGQPLPMQLPSEVDWEKLLKLQAYYNVQLYEQEGMHWIAPTYTLENVTFSNQKFTADFTMPDTQLKLRLVGVATEVGMVIHDVIVLRMTHTGMALFVGYNVALNKVEYHKGSMTLDGWVCKPLVRNVLKHIQVQGTMHRYSLDRLQMLVEHLSDK